MRYVARYRPDKHAWFVYDLNNQSFGDYGYISKHSANKRVDRLNGQIIAAKARMKSDYGLSHPVDAPAPRAFKD